MGPASQLLISYAHHVSKRKKNQSHDNVISKKICNNTLRGNNILHTTIDLKNKLGFIHK